MEFTAAEIEEFKNESLDLIDSAEKALMALDQGGSLATHYDSVFRAFHSIKGAAGMMEITPLQSHMHQLENLLVGQKDRSDLEKKYIDLFLRGLDACRRLLDNEAVEFDYRTDSAVTAPTPTIPSVVASVERPGTIVIVDDEPELVDLLSTILVTRGFAVHGTSDPTEVERLVKQHTPDLVLTDVSMPIMNGNEVLAMVKRINVDLPVIFVSAHLYRESLMHAIGLGVYGVVEKPFEADRVAELCRQAIERFKLNQLFNKSVNLLLYQFSDLAEFLAKNNRDDVRQTLSREITELLERRRAMRQVRPT